MKAAEHPTVRRHLARSEEQLSERLAEQYILEADRMRYDLAVRAAEMTADVMAFTLPAYGECRAAYPWALTEGDAAWTLLALAHAQRRGEPPVPMG